MKLTAEEFIELATIVLSKPVIANKYDVAASRLSAHVLESIESPDERRERFEKWLVDRWFSTKRESDGWYSSVIANISWTAWSAALDFGGGGGE